MPWHEIEIIKGYLTHRGVKVIFIIQNDTKNEIVELRKYVEVV